MLLDKIEIGSKFPQEFNAVIEIPANSLPVKYEIDKNAGVLVVDRFLSTAMIYPINYGFVPHTLSQDGDPVDVMVLTPYPVAHGVVVKCRAIAILKMEDEQGIDAKVLALPSIKSCPVYADMHTLDDLPKLLLKQIEHFFEHYKGLESGKWVKLSGWDGIEAALHELTTSQQRYNAKQ